MSTNIFSTILPKSDGINFDLTTCMLANVSICPQSQSDASVIAIYNPLGRTISEYIRLPVDNNCYDVEGPDGEDVQSQVLPEISNFKYLKDMQPGPNVLTFNADNLPPLGIKLYRITQKNCQKDDKNVNRNERATIGNEVTTQNQKLKQEVIFAFSGIQRNDRSEHWFNFQHHTKRSNCSG